MSKWPKPPPPTTSISVLHTSPMSTPRRFLQTLTTATKSPLPPSQPLPADSNVVVILAALLCAVICVVGLGLVARCAWLRRNFSSSSSLNANTYLSSPNKGIKKKVLKSIPKISFQQAFGVEGGKVSTDCPICLAEFVDGDEIRVLPQCGHGFHVECVDTWLRSHSSCPFCRRLVGPKKDVGAGTCRRCGASGVTPEVGSAVAEREVAAVVVVDDRREKRAENCEGSS